MYASLAWSASRRSLTKRGTTTSLSGQSGLPNGKLTFASPPSRRTDSMSYAFAAYAAEWKLPIQIRSLVLRSVISATHVPHARCRTPRYFLCGGGSGRSNPPPRNREEDVPLLNREEDAPPLNLEEDAPPLNREEDAPPR